MTGEILIVGGLALAGVLFAVAGAGYLVRAATRRGYRRDRDLR